MDTQSKRIVRPVLVALSSLALLLGACKGGGSGADAGVQTAAGQQQAAGAGQSFAIAANFTPLTFTGHSGGNVNAATHGEECTGNIASSPDFTMNVTGTVNASVTATSTTDTTLVIVGPGGPYCNDDTIEYNPVVTAAFAEGTYQVFVGNFSSEEGPAEFTLTVTPAVAEVPTSMPGAMPTTMPAPMPTTMPAGGP